MRRRLAWALWLAIVAIYGWARIESGSASDDGPAGFVAYTIFTLVFATVGALVASRRPENPLGWILLGSGIAYSVGGLALSQYEGARDDGHVLAAWVSSWVWMAGIAPTGTFGLLLFPTGHLPSPRWRPVAWIAAAGGLMVWAGLAFAPGKMLDHPADNPVGFGPEWLTDAVASVGAVLLVVAAAGAVISLRVRYRAAGATERGQLKWLTYAGALMGVGVLVSAALEQTGGAAADLSNAIVTVSLAAVPAAIGIAILRHGLYDVDVVINRTLVYGGLTAVLAGAYLATVLLLQLALSPLTQDSGLAVAASTLAAAALFRPLRARIQGAVDRRFYRRRYDAARTLEGFSARLREELDLDALGAGLRDVVHETVQPAHVTLWLRERRP